MVTRGLGAGPFFTYIYIYIGKSYKNVFVRNYVTQAIVLFSGDSANYPRLAIDRSICILTRPVVNTGFNRSLLVDWWSNGRLKMVDLKILT